MIDDIIIELDRYIDIMNDVNTQFDEWDEIIKTKQDIIEMED